MKRAITFLTTLLACTGMLWGNYTVTDSTTDYPDYPYATKIVRNDALGRYGVLDRNDKILIDFSFDSISYADKTYADTSFVVTIGEQHSVYGYCGKRIAPDWYDELNFDTIEMETDQERVFVIAPAKKAGLSGFIDFNGSILIPVEYDSARGISITDDNRLIAAVTKGDKSGILDEKGKWILPLQEGEAALQSVLSLGDCELFLDSNEKCWAMKMTTGQAFNKKYYNLVGPDANDVFAASDDGEVFRLITWDDVEVSPKTFSLLYPAGESMMLAGNNSGKYALITDQGEQITDYIFKDTGCDPGDFYYHDGPFYHFKLGKLICIVMSDFHDGLALVESLDSKKYLYDDIHAIRYGFLNTKGRWVIKPKYVDAYPFEDGFAVVQSEEGGEWLKIDTKGRVVEHLGLTDPLNDEEYDDTEDIEN